MRNLDWCEYACIDARDLGNTWYWDWEKDFACNPSWSQDDATRLQRARRAPQISLASEAVSTQSQSKAGYYIAGASFVGAAAIALHLYSRKSKKSVDDEFIEL